MHASSSDAGHSPDNPLDVLIIGGGINGAGLAHDAAGRGLKVGLYEAYDFASGTSSASSKLIHGGLRYLEQYHFRLVKESLQEREILMQSAPHLVRPIRFCIPHRPWLRPAWLIRAGLFLYDRLSRENSLPSSRKITLGNQPDLQDDIEQGFVYSDCQVNDARLVMLNILAAKKHGAEVRNYCAVNEAKARQGLWEVTLLDQRTQQATTRYSKTLVNTTGPWVNRTAQDILHTTPPADVRLVKGSHILIHNRLQEKKNYLLQTEEGRVVFVIQWQEKWLLIGTTDEETDESPETVSLSDKEADYLLTVYNGYFKKPLERSDIKQHFSGIRALIQDRNPQAQSVTRDYAIVREEKDGAPLITLYGGKLTTYRKVAEKILENLSEDLENMGEPHTDTAKLPGAITTKDLPDLQSFLLAKGLSEQAIKRLIYTYGSLCKSFLEDNFRLLDPDTGFTDKEKSYLETEEMAYTDKDIWLRRTYKT